MDYRQVITIEAGKRSGKPCIRGLRITVSAALGGYRASTSTPSLSARHGHHRPSRLNDVGNAALFRALTADLVSGTIPTGNLLRHVTDGTAKRHAGSYS
jgi:hypothetical protein